ncbi:MAG: RND family transporter [Candidatus Omnitrophica bacterium]|nr:RND family transporter [Candidatus Omnitrophota bacterium]
MKNILDKFFRYILDHSSAVIILTALVTVLSVAVLPQIKMDNGVDVFFNKKSSNYIDFQAWKEQFGSDQVVMVAFKDADIFTQKNLELISRLTNRFEDLPDVDKVTSLTNVNDVIGQEQDFIVRPFVENVPEDPVALKALRHRALSNPLFLKNVISADGTSTAFIIELIHKKGSEDKYKKELVDNVNKVLIEEFPKGKKYYVSGFTTIEVIYARFMQSDLATFIPLMFLILLAVLILSFRTFYGVLLPLVGTLISLVWTMAFLYLCGFSINNVTTIIPPVMLSITLLESIHFLWELILKSVRLKPKDLDSNQNEIIRDTMHHLFWPCFLTNITTVVGFYSLLISSVPPIQQLGFVAGTGVFFAFIITFTFLPAVIKQFSLLRHLYNPKDQATGANDTELYGFAFLQEAPDKIIMSVARFSIRHKEIILITSLVVGIVSTWATFKIKTETSVIEYFRKDSPVRQATDFIESHLSGVHMINISLRAGTEDYFKDPRELKKIEDIEKFLYTIPVVDKVTSVVDYLKEINKSFHDEDARYYAIPDSRNLVAQYVLLYGADDLSKFMDSRWEWASVRVRLKEHSTAKLQKIIAEINSYLKENVPAGISSRVLGQTVLEVDSNEAVTNGQVLSLAFAMLVIFGMMFIDFRSIPVGFLSIIPNLLPLLVNFGIMGLFAIRLDSATSMISDIGIGIIVDDTIHFFHAFGEEMKKTNNNREESVYRCFASKGRPTVITSLILIMGFGVVGFSRFVPTYYFGILSAVLIFNGLWIELVLNPALLTFFKPKFK